MPTTPGRYVGGVVALVLALGPRPVEQFAIGGGGNGAVSVLFQHRSPRSPDGPRGILRQRPRRTHDDVPFFSLVVRRAGGGLVPFSPGDDDDDKRSEAERRKAERAAREAFWRPYTTSELEERSKELKIGGENRVAAQYVVLLTQKHPNELVRDFYASASMAAQVAVRDAIQAVLGALDVEWTTTGKRVAELCFRLQMTGYMLRNAEYVEALKKVLNVERTTRRRLREAFDEIDKDRDGHLSLEEVEALFDKIYYASGPSEDDFDASSGTFLPSSNDAPVTASSSLAARQMKDPATEGKKRKEIESFLQFFDADGDGYVSFEEFRRGFGPAAATQGYDIDDEDEDAATALLPNPEISGTIDLVFPDGRTRAVDAAEYAQDLRREAEMLRDALDAARATTPGGKGSTGKASSSSVSNALQFIEQAGQSDVNALSRYVNPKGGNALDGPSALADTLTPDARDAIHQLVGFVLAGAGDPKRGKIPPDARLTLQNRVLQQLCQWQIVVGYRVRELEALGVASDRAGK